MAIPWKFSARTPGQLIQSADPNNLSEDIRNSQTGVSVTLFGSSAAEIQDAINTVGAAGGGTVFFPAGTYSLAGTPLYIQYSNITIRFEPGATITQTGNNVDGIRIGAASDGSFVQVDNIRIEGGSFIGDADGTGSNVASGIVAMRSSGAYANGSGGSSNITIDGIHAEGWTMGVNAIGVTGLTVRNSSFTHMWYVAALSAGGYGVITQTCYRVHVENNQFLANSDGDRHAIYIASDGSKGSSYQGEEIHITGNVVHWETPVTTTQQESGIAIHGTKGLEFRGNHITGGYNNVIFSLPFGSGRDYVISGNVFRDSLSSGGPGQRAGVLFSYHASNIYEHVAFTGNVSTQANDFVFGMTFAAMRHLLAAGNVISVAGASVGSNGPTAGIYAYSTHDAQIGPNNLDGRGTANTGERYASGGDENLAIRRIPGVATGFGTALSNASGAEVTNATSQDATIITDLTADASPVGSTDYVMTYDASAGTLKKVLLDDLPGGGGGTAITRHAEDFTGSATDTFTLAAAPIDADHATVYVNGLRQVPTTDWTLSGDTITTTFTVDAGDKVSVEYWT